jgi:hypothetical protein
MLFHFDDWSDSVNTKLATYLMMFDELEKVVPNEFSTFQSRAEKCLMVMKLCGWSGEFKDLVLYVQNAQGKFYDDYVDEDESIRDKIDDTISHIVGFAFQDLQNAFEERTGLDMYVNWGKEKNWLYVDFPEEDVMFSDKIKKLYESKVGMIYEMSVDL